jgi:DNA polymerase-3 subunit gamma/tau
MSYQVLARKWRPRDFSSLVGQEHVVRALRHALEQQRLHHAYLFTGTRGVGKTTLARILAKCLNCEKGISPAPCGSCSACLEIDGGRFVDLLEVDAATNTRVDEMRQLLDTAQYSPTRGRFKIYVIDEVHMLSNSAFNAMLKTLEEPPEHLKFILATTDPQKIPVTVLSRCLQFSLRQMPRQAIAEHLAHLLEAEKISFDPDALPLISRAAAGSMRDALSLLDQAISHGAGKVAAGEVREMLGAVDETILLRLLEAVAAEDAQRGVAIADELQARSLSFDGALAEMARLLLRVSVLQLVPESLDADDFSGREALAGLAARLDREAVQLLYQIALQGRSDLLLAPDEYSGFVMTVLRMIAFRPEEQDVPGGTGRASSAPRSVGAPRPTAAVTVARGSGVGDWATLVGRLQVTGAARELARNAELVTMEGTRIELRVPAALSYLAEKAYQDKLKGALEAEVGAAISLNVTAGEVKGESAAAREQSERDAKRADAVRAVQGDRFVREVVNLFDGSVVEQSIRPTSSGKTKSG